jgi:prepilin peptidase CpaA
LLLTAAAVATAAAASDLRTRRIPNWLTVPALLLGLTLNTLIYRWPGARESLKGAGLGLALLLPFFLLRSIGGGDWKLVGAIGAFLGPSALLTVLFWALLLAGLMALVLIIYKGRLVQTLRNIGHVVASLLSLRMPGSQVSLDNPEALKIPFGVAMGLAVVIYCAHAFAAKL